MLRYQVDSSALGTLEESEETDDMLKVMEMSSAFTLNYVELR